MVARITTVAFQGIDVLDVDVQVSMAGAGTGTFTIVGLPDKAVAESRERVRAALGALGLGLPPERITVNLAPADLLKEGSHFDLPIALGLLVAMRVLPADEIAGYMALGELGLDATIAPVSGVLPAAVAANARDRGLICPAAEGSAEVASRVAHARAIQSERYQDGQNGKPLRTNAEVDGERLMAVAAPDAGGADLLANAVDAMKLSARAYHRILRVARTLADLEGAKAVRRPHIAEALSYRRLSMRA